MFYNNCWHGNLKMLFHSHVSGSHSEPQQNGSKPAPHGNEASLGSTGSTPPPTNGLYSPTSEVSDELNLKNESEDLESPPKDKLPGRVGPPRKTRRSKKGGNEKDEKEDFRTISLKLLLPGQTDTIDIMVRKGGMIILIVVLILFN